MPFLSDQHICSLCWCPAINSSQIVCAEAIHSEIQVVTQLKSTGCEEVEVQLDSKRLSFRSSKSSSMMHETEINLYPEPSDGNLCLYAERDSEVCARYSFRHFQRVGRLCKAGRKVLFQMADDAPLSINCYLADGGSCQLFLAPLIE